MPRNEQQTSPQILHQLSGVPLTEYEHGCLQDFLAIVRDCRGSATPVESFLKTLVCSHRRSPLTPDCIRSDFAELEENWADFISDAVFTIQQYPELVRQQLPEGSLLRTTAEIRADAEECIRAGEQDGREAAERERRQAESRAMAKRFDANYKARKRAFRKKFPKESERIEQFIDWAKTLNAEARNATVLQSIEILVPGAADGKVSATHVMPQTKKAPSSGKRGARKSSTLDEKAGTLSGTGYQVINEPTPMRPEMPA